MSSTPMIDELKEACGSNKFHNALRLFFLHDEADNEGLALVLIERCDELRASIGKKRQLLREGGIVEAPDNVVANANECLEESMYKDLQVLAAMTVLLDVVHEARTQKRRHVVTMEQFN
ncbi:hypothetical protein CTI12_AA426410 [Artemisia annua]|uniref:Uncharacterized protein n=1 Tax=Artemisia annua TaxID=35608 RepID=A0A2U1LLP0_ARTAN|nr:hypothetical protein CTI12_AA426410 [Artemisia annua]